MHIYTCGIDKLIHVLVTVIDFHDKTKMLIKMINKQYI